MANNASSIDGNGLVLTLPGKVGQAEPWRGWIWGWPPAPWPRRTSGWWTWGTEPPGPPAAAPSKKGSNETVSRCNGGKFDPFFTNRIWIWIRIRWKGCIFFILVYWSVGENMMIYQEKPRKQGVEKRGNFYCTSGEISFFDNICNVYPFTLLHTLVRQSLKTSPAHLRPLQATPSLKRTIISYTLGKLYTTENFRDSTIN